MGAWGPGAFENDAALDWAAKLERSRSLDPILKVLQKLDRAGLRRVDADSASIALAAAEVVSALNLAPADDLPSSVREWVELSLIRVDQDLLDLALKSVRRAATSSELRDLWEENEAESPEWYEAVADLERRLNQGPHPGAERLKQEQAAARRKEIASRPKPRMGDLLWIPLSEQQSAVGIVLLLPARYKIFMQLGFFGSLFSAPEEVSPHLLRGPYLCPPWFVLTSVVSHRLWKVIGNDPSLCGHFSLPTIQDGDTLYKGDQVVPFQASRGLSGEYPTGKFHGERGVVETLRLVLIEGRPLNRDGYHARSDST